MLLSLVIPCQSTDDPQLLQLLDDLHQQDFPADQYEVLVSTEKGAEAAKAHAANRATGEVVGFFCADNRVLDRSFLRETVLWWINVPSIHGAYSAHYALMPFDASLSRYFALLGGNDPICWWMGRQDRQMWRNRHPSVMTRLAADYRLPSVGENGFFIRRSLLGLLDPLRHFHIDTMVDIVKREGELLMSRLGPPVWHRTGTSLRAYLKRRAHYTRTLYWERYAQRRWRMVETWGDLGRVGLFVLASLLIVPQLLVGLYGWWRDQDDAWLCHPIVCWCLTWMHLWIMTCAIPSLCVAWVEQQLSNVASMD